MACHCRMAHQVVYLWTRDLRASRFQNWDNTCFETLLICFDMHWKYFDFNELPNPDPKKCSIGVFWTALFQSKFNDPEGKKKKKSFSKNGVEIKQNTVNESEAGFLWPCLLGNTACNPTGVLGPPIVDWPGLRYTALILILNMNPDGNCLTVFSPLFHLVHIWNWFNSLFLH